MLKQTKLNRKKLEKEEMTSARPTLTRNTRIKLPALKIAPPCPWKLFPRPLNKAQKKETDSWS